MNLISSNSVEIKELNLRQILIRGDHAPALLKLVKSSFKISLPKNNLEIEEDKNNPIRTFTKELKNGEKIVMDGANIVAEHFFLIIER